MTRQAYINALRERIDYNAALIITCEWCGKEAPFADRVTPEGWEEIVNSAAESRFACPPCAEREIPNE